MRSGRLSRPVRAVLAVALAMAVVALAGPANAQKRGGTLTIVWDEDGRVRMTGPAVLVAEGATDL